MCLVVYKIEVLTEDKIVYKVQEKGNKSRWVSLFKGHLPKYNVELFAKFDQEHYISSNFSPIVHSKLKSGYFHAFTDLDTAKEIAYDWSGRVIECIIKAGNTVYYGDDDEIACSKLIQTRKILANYS